jgi:hypothetical protein
VKTSLNGLTEKGAHGEADEALPPWLRSWLVVAGVWLQVIVVVFIVVCVSHVKTPVIYWVDKMNDLFTESR